MGKITGTAVINRLNKKYVITILLYSKLVFITEQYVHIYKLLIGPNNIRSNKDNQFDWPKFLAVLVQGGNTLLI